MKKLREGGFPKEVSKSVAREWSQGSTKGEYKTKPHQE